MLLKIEEDKDRDKKKERYKDKTNIARIANAVQVTI